MKKTALLSTVFLSGLVHANSTQVDLNILVESNSEPVTKANAQFVVEVDGQQPLHIPMATLDVDVVAHSVAEKTVEFALVISEKNEDGDSEVVAMHTIKAVYEEPAQVTLMDEATTSSMTITVTPHEEIVHNAEVHSAE